MDTPTPLLQSNPPPPRIPPQSPRQGGGYGWIWIGLVVLFLGFVALVAIIVVPLAMRSHRTPGHRTHSDALHEVVLEDNRSRHKIAVVELSGLIAREGLSYAGLDMVEAIEAQFDRAAEDEAVAAVILRIDSPGGEVMASDDIAKAISKFQKKSNKPVVASMSGIAASGGYYVAAPCRWIVANELTLTGSIGVILSSYNYRGLMDKVGLHPQVFKSGKFKDMLSGDKEVKDIDPEETKMIQAIVDDTFQKFKQVVADGRKQAGELNQSQGKALVQNWEEFADGRVLTGKQAFEHGFVDEQGDFEAAVERTKRIANVQDANLVQFSAPFGLANFLGLLGKSHAPAIQVDLGFDVPKLLPGKPYFLTPMFVH